MNGVVSTANFSLEASGGGDAAGGGAGTATCGAEVGVEAGAAVATCVGLADGAGTGPALSLAIDVTLGADVSSLVKYRNPPTPIAERLTSVTATGHIQFGGPEYCAFAGFLTCGVA